MAGGEDFGLSFATSSGAGLKSPFSVTTGGNSSQGASGSANHRDLFIIGGIVAGLVVLLILLRKG